jgi:predicted nucleic acid-binding protein
MSAKPFLDTNVLIYSCVANDPRRGKAESLVASGGVISIQVLNEFVNVCRNKLNLKWPQIEEARDIFKNLLDAPIPLTLDLHQGAVVLTRDHGLAFYDGLIVAAAISANCDTLYTEDMQHGRRIGTVTIRNPFL